MHFESFSTQFSRHLLMDKVRNILMRCHLTCEQLRAWSRDVREDFLNKNRRIIPESTEPTPEISIEKLENTVALLQSQVIDLSRKIDVQNQLLHQILDAVVNPHMPLNHHQSHRKRKAVEIADTSDKIDDKIYEHNRIEVEVFEPLSQPFVCNVSVPAVDLTIPNNIQLYSPIESLSGIETSGKIIQTPFYSVISLSDISISMMLQDYYKYQLHLNRYQKDVCRPNRSRIKAVVEFMIALMTKEQVAIMKNITSNFDRYHYTTEKYCRSNIKKCHGSVA